MDTACEMIDEPQQSLVKRIYYSARDGMAIALYTLLNDKSDAEVDHLINQVNHLLRHLSPSLLTAKLHYRSFISDNCHNRSINYE